jgi:hypothetical protein
MNYVKVESSQIAEVGFGEGFFGPETLGLKFQPAKWQQKKGLPGSEYHYGNHGPIPDRVLATGKLDEYFNDVIKSRPDLYPFQKIEPGTTVETVPSVPIAALATIDQMSDTDLFTPGATSDEKLMAIREAYLTEAKKYDISTPAKRAKLKSLAFELVKLRTSVEGRAKAHTIEMKRKLALIDSEKRRLCEIIEGIKNEVRAPLTEWEDAEKARVSKLERTLSDIQTMRPYSYADIPALRAALVELEAIDPEAMQEFKVPIAMAREQALAVLYDDLARRSRAEAQFAELERLRAAETARAEQDRLAQAAKEAREQAERDAAAETARLERERQAAEQRAQEAEARAEAERQESARRAEEAAAQAKRDQDAAVEAERQRVAAKAAEEYAEMERRAANKKHRDKIVMEIRDAMIHERVGLSIHDAALVIEAIQKGLVPHVTIVY